IVGAALTGTDDVGEWVERLEMPFLLELRATVYMSGANRASIRDSRYLECWCRSYGQD
ncbi:hypothetical protein COCMIDRAFT_84167, partial [Bipolaris oryzae ATCC 44560]